MFSNNKVWREFANDINGRDESTSFSDYNLVTEAATSITNIVGENEMNQSQSVDANSNLGNILSKHDEDGLTKFRKIGELIETIELLNAEFQFIEFFNNQIAKYHTPNGRVFKGYSLNQDVAPPKLHKLFVSAVAFSTHLLIIDPHPAINILNGYLKEFNTKHMNIFQATFEQSQDFEKTLSILLRGEKNEITKNQVCAEMLQMMEVRRNILNLHNKAIKQPITGEFFYTSLEVIRNLLVKVEKFEAVPMPTTNHFIASRENPICEIQKFLTDELNQIVDNLIQRKVENEMLPQQDVLDTQNEVDVVELPPTDMSSASARAHFVEKS